MIYSVTKLFSTKGYWIHSKNISSYPTFAKNMSGDLPKICVIKKASSLIVLYTVLMCIHCITILPLLGGEKKTLSSTSIKVNSTIVVDR